jgi:hypothetical protein
LVRARVKELRGRADFDPAIRRLVVVDGKRGTGIPPQVSHLDVVRPAEDVESALPPLVPDRRKQHASVPAIGGEHGHER